MPRLIALFFALSFCGTAQAAPIYGAAYSSPAQLLRTCKQNVAKAISEQKKADANGPRTRAVERLAGQLDAIRSSCGQWYDCQERCHARIKADCKALKGRAKRQCKKARRQCKRKKCKAETEVAQCRERRNTFWINIDHNLWNLWRGKPGKSLNARARAAKSAALSCTQVFPSTAAARVKNVSKYR